MKAIRWSMVAPFLTALCVACFIALPARGLADDRDRDRDRDADQLRLVERDRERIKNRIHRETGMELSELAVLDAEIDRALELGSDGEQIREVVRTSAENGCATGSCLREMIRNMNRVMERKFTRTQARDAVCEAIREQTRTRERSREKERAAWNEEEFCLQVRNRVRQRIAQMDQNRKRHTEEMEWRGERPGEERPGGRR